MYVMNKTQCLTHNGKVTDSCHSPLYDGYVCLCMCVERVISALRCVCTFKSPPPLPSPLLLLSPPPPFPLCWREDKRALFPWAVSERVHSVNEQPAVISGSLGLNRGSLVRESRASCSSEEFGGVVVVGSPGGARGSNKPSDDTLHLHLTPTCQQLSMFFLFFFLSLSHRLSLFSLSCIDEGGVM